MTSLDTQTDHILKVQRPHISVVSATFRLGCAYQDNLWVESLADLGIAVSVITSQNGEDEDQVVHEVSTASDATYTVYRLKAYTFSRNVTLTSTLADTVLELAPDCVIWIDALMYFGRELYLDPRLRDVPLITIYNIRRRSDSPLRWSDAALTWRERLRGLTFQTLRAPTLTQSIRRAHLTITNTPAATRLIRQYVWHNERFAWARKHEEFPLGFCPHTFAYQPSLRAAARLSLNLPPSETTLLFSIPSRANQHATLSRCYQVAEACLSQQKSNGESFSHMIWLGDESDELRSLIAGSIAPERHHLISHQTRAKLATWYHTADLVLFPHSCDSAPDALGTGARVLCSLDPLDPNLKHLQACTTNVHTLDIDRWPAYLLIYARQRRVVSPHQLEATRQVFADDARALSYSRIVKNSLIALGARLQEMSTPLRALIEETRLNSRS